MKKLICLVLATILSVSALAGCGQSAAPTSSPAKDAPQPETAADGNGGESGKRYTIALVPQQVGIPYFETSNTWAARAGEALGCDVIYTGPTSGDAAAQANIIQDLITKNVDCIAVSPLDSSAIAPVLKQANEAGIMVLTWDSEVEDKSLRKMYINSCTEKLLGDHLMQRLAHYMGEKGEYAIITSVLTAQNCSAWAQYATEYQEANYPDMKRVAYEPCDDDQAKAYSITQNLMTAYPDLKGVLGVTTTAPAAAAQAVREAGKSGEVVVSGVVEASVSREYLKDGSMQEANIWHPGKLGYLTIFVAKTLLDGGSMTDGQEVPEVGKVQIDGDQVIMTELLDITKENVDEFDF